MTSSPTCLEMARDSPVIIDSSTSAVPSTIRPSAGTRAPGRTSTTSSNCNALIGTSSVPSAATRSAVSGSRAARAESAPCACAIDRISSQWPEQHDRDQGGQFPPDLDLEEAERAGPRGHEGDDDRQRDEGHHPGLAVGQLALGSADEDQPAVEEDDRPEDRRHVLDARDRRDRVADPARDLRAQQHGRDGQGKAQPELVAEHRHRVAGVPVMPRRVTLVMGGGRGRRFVVLLVGCVIHPGLSLRYSPPVSTKRQDPQGAAQPGWPSRWPKRHGTPRVRKQGVLDRRTARWKISRTAVTVSVLMWSAAYVAATPMTSLAAIRRYSVATGNSRKEGLASE